MRRYKPSNLNIQMQFVYALNAIAFPSQKSKWALILMHFYCIHHFCSYLPKQLFRVGKLNLIIKFLHSFRLKTCHNRFLDINLDLYQNLHSQAIDLVVVRFFRKIFHENWAWNRTINRNPRRQSHYTFISYIVWSFHGNEKKKKKTHTILF